MPDRLDHDRRDDDARCVQTVNVYPDQAGAVLLSEVLHKLNRVLAVQEQQGVLMAQISADLQAARASLAAANEATNEIAADVADLVARATEADAGSAEAVAIKAEADALANRLRGVADTYTPGAGPSDPPAEEA